MNTCPDCGTLIPDGALRCDCCGRAVAGSGGGTAAAAPSPAGGDEDVRIAINSMRAGLAEIENAPLPAAGDTLRLMTPLLCLCAAAYLVLAGVLTCAPIFYIAAAAAAIFGAVKLMQRRNGRIPVGEGQAAVNAAIRIFDEDCAKLLAGHTLTDDERSSIEALRNKAVAALHRQQAGHAANRRRIAVVAAAVLAAVSVAVGALAIRNRSARAAEAEYARLPEWVKLRDAYIEAGNDEFSDNSLRMAVIGAMLSAGQTDEAEGFFFGQCQGCVGDRECAEAIAGYYRSAGRTEALRDFVGRISLRYDSDTKALRTLMR